MRAAATLLICWAAAAAQTPVARGPEAAPALGRAGGYTATNSFEVGQRFVGVDGNRDVYRSAVNYGNGLRLLEGSLRIHSEDGRARWLDEFSFHTLGAAADPYQTHTARAEKHGLYQYDLRASLARYANRLPMLWQGERALDTERLWQHHDLTLRPGSRFEVLLGYDRNSQSGPGFESAGIPDAVGAFRRENFLRYRADLFRVNNNYRAGANLRFAGLAVTALQSFDNYKEDARFADGSGFPSAVSNVQPAESVARSDPFHGNTPVSTVAVRTEKERRAGVHGRFVWAGGRRNVALDENVVAADPARGLATPRRTFVLGDASRRQALGDFTVTAMPTSRWTLTNTTAFQSTSIVGGARFLEVTSFTSELLRFEDLSIRHATNATEASYRPARTFSVYAAYRFSTRRTGAREAIQFPNFGFAQPLVRIDNDVHTGGAGLRWMPAKSVRASFDFDVGRADRPLAPASDKNFHNESARVQWRGKTATVTANYQSRVNNNPAALVEYSSRVRGGGVQASWAPAGGRATMYGGYSFAGIDTAAGIYNLLAVPLDPGARARTEYASNLHTVNFGGRLAAGARLTLFFGYMLAKDAGDGRGPLVSAGGFEAGYAAVAADVAGNLRLSFPLTYHSPQARATILLREGLAWNVGYQRYGYSERASGLQDYTANTGYTSLAWSF